MFLSKSPRPAQIQRRLDGKTGLPGISQGCQNLDCGAKCALQRRLGLDEKTAGGSPDPGVPADAADAGGFFHRRAETYRRRPGLGPRRSVATNGEHGGETTGRFGSRLISRWQSTAVPAVTKATDFF